MTGQTVKNLFTGEDAIDIVPIDDTTADFTPDTPWLTREHFSTPSELTEYRKKDALRTPFLMDMTNYLPKDGLNGIMQRPINSVTP